MKGMRGLGSRAVLVGAFLSLAVGGCAASGASTARKAAYNAPPGEVWRVVVEELQGSFPDLQTQDDEARLATTCWMVVEKNTPGVSASNVPGWKLYRIQAAMSPGAPWRVRLTGVAADYLPGSPVITPIQAGADDEPYWVEPRTDRVYRHIYDRLQATATHNPAPPDVVARGSRPQENLEGSCIYDGGEYKGSAKRVPHFKTGKMNPGI
jgi:hypothetical protein